MTKRIASCVFVLFLAASPRALAGPIPSPTRVLIPATGGVASVTITNDETEARTYRFAAMAWAQGDDGVPVLTPTDEIQISPSTLSLGRGEAGLLKIQAGPQARSGQGAFRITIKSSAAPLPAGVVQVIPVIDFPVFVGGGEGPAGVRLEGTDVRDGKLVATLANPGPSYVRPKTVALVGRSADGREAFRQEWSGWYILAGAKRSYWPGIKPDQCAGVASFELSVDLGEDAPRVVTTPWRAERCKLIARSAD